MNDYNNTNNNENGVNQNTSDQNSQGYQNYQSYQQGQDQNSNSYYYTNQSNQQYGQDYNPMYNPVPPKQKDTFGIVSLCLALAIFVLPLFCCCCPPIASAIFYAIPAIEIAAVVFAVLSRKKMGRFTGLSIAGMIISIIILLIILIMVIVTVSFYLQNQALFDNMEQLLTDPEYYKEFLPEHYPTFYYEYKEEIDEFFKTYFEQYNDMIGGTVIQ